MWGAWRGVGGKVTQPVSGRQLLDKAVECVHELTLIQVGSLEAALLPGWLGCGDHPLRRPPPTACLLACLSTHVTACPHLTPPGSSQLHMPGTPTLPNQLIPLYPPTILFCHRHYIRDFAEAQVGEVELFLNSVPILNPLTKQEKLRLLDAFEEKEYGEGDQVGAVCGTQGVREACC